MACRAAPRTVRSKDPRAAATYTPLSTAPLETASLVRQPPRVRAVISECRPVAPRSARPTIVAAAPVSRSSQRLCASSAGRPSSSLSPLGPRPPRRALGRLSGGHRHVAEDYNSFGRSMVKKLIAEIATRPAQQRSVSTMNVQARTMSNSSSRTWIAPGPARR